jgi:hypothetical protein
MATQTGRFNTISLVADEALTAHTFVTLSSDAQAAYVAADGDDAIGVTYGAADAGKMVTVQIDGIAMVKANEAITAGAAVSSDTAGEAIPADAGEARLGYALEAASGAGEIISVLLKPAGADAA